MWKVCRLLTIQGLGRQEFLQGSMLGQAIKQRKHSRTRDWMLRCECTAKRFDEIGAPSERLGSALEAAKRVNETIASVISLCLSSRRLYLCLQS